MPNEPPADHPFNVYRTIAKFWTERVSASECLTKSGVAFTPELACSMMIEAMIVCIAAGITPSIADLESIQDHLTKARNGV